MSDSKPAVPVWRLAGFFFFNFTILGLFIPFWPVYLQGKGYSAVEIGALLAVMLATRIVGPNFWGWVADRRDAPVQVIQLTSLFALLSFLAIFVVDGFWGMAAMLAAMGWFWNATLPQFEAVTLRYLGSNHHDYGKIRAWGSVGFIVAVLLGGWAIDSWGYAALPHVFWPCFLLLWFSSLLLPVVSAEHNQAAVGTLLAVLRQPAVITLLLLVCLMQVSHAVYYAFYSVWMGQHGFSSGEIAALWSLGVLAEIGIFVLTGKLLSRWSAERLLLFSLLVTALRWQIIAWLPESVPAVISAQLMHAITYGVYHAAAIQLVHRYFKGGLDARGQGLYSSVSFGVGGSIGAFCMGQSWQYWGAIPSFGLASAVALIALFVGMLGFSLALTGSNR